MFQTFSGTLRNVVFSNISVAHTGDKDGIHNNNVGGIVGSGGCTVSGCTSTTANLSAEWSVHKKTSDYSYCQSDAIKAAG